MYVNKFYNFINYNKEISKIIAMMFILHSIKVLDDK